MFSQSCSLLQNKNQSPLSPFSHNLGLVATRSYSSSTKTFMDIKPIPEHKTRPLQCNQSKKNMNLLDFVYSLNNNSTRIRPTSNLPTDMQNLHSKSMKTKNHCKALLEVPSMPITSSYLVGGFVGSKSQLGCRSNQSFDLNMWDLLGNFGFADFIKSNPSFHNKNSIDQQNSCKESELNSLIKDSMILGCTTNCPFKSPCDDKASFASKKQSYAEVARTNLPMASNKDSQIHSSVLTNSISLSDKQDLMENSKLPCTCSGKGLSISSTIPGETPSSFCQNNKEVGITNIKLNLSSVSTKDTMNTDSSPGACEESPTNSSAISNSQIRNLVTGCQRFNRPRPLPAREVKINETKIPTVNDQILSAASPNSTMKGEEVNCENSTISEPLIKGILKKTLKCAEQFNDKGQSALVSRLSEPSDLQNRSRIVSQCSEDSEDSFVVFEQSEDDTSDYSDVDGSDVDDSDGDSSCCESDEDSLLTTEVSSNFLFLSSYYTCLG